MDCELVLDESGGLRAQNRHALNGLFSKKMWLVLGAGAVRNRTYRRVEQFLVTVS